LVAEVAAALLPPLRLLATRIGYSVERWADDIAGIRCGDRHLVAATLGKVALHTPPPATLGFGGLGFVARGAAGLGVAARMQALLEPPVTRPHPHRLLALWGVVVAAAATAVVQVHHLDGLVAALCPH
jgi:hypothetical protein